MPKFRVQMTETVTTVYSDVEVEADSQEDAVYMVIEMARNGELDEKGGRSSWVNDTVEVA